jgi:hypothetical protein
MIYHEKIRSRLEIPAKKYSLSISEMEIKNAPTCKPYRRQSYAANC